MKQQQRILASLIILVLAQTAFSANRLVISGNPTPLTHGGYRLFHPSWSPDGKYIAMTSDNYRGIWVMDAKAYNISPICDEERVGYGFQWSEDSKEIACRVTKTGKHRRLTAIKIFDIGSGISRLVTDYRQRIGLPFWADSDLRVCFTSDDKFEVVSSERKVRPASSKNGAVNKSEIVLFQSYGRIIIANLDLTHKSIIVDPRGRFLNPVLSPNKEKIAFEMTDGRIYVMNTDGTDIFDLGSGSYPRWSPNSEYIVYFVSEDDGQRVLASDIFLTDIRGQQRLKVTNTQDRIEMHPDWSPDGHYLVYDEYETGVIYQIKLGMEKETAARKK